MRRLKVIYLAIRHSVLDLCFIYWITRRLDVRRMIWCVTDLKIAFTHTHTHTHTYIYIYIYIYIYVRVYRYVPPKDVSVKDGRRIILLYYIILLQ